MKKPARLGVKIALAIVSVLLLLTMMFPSVKLTVTKTSGDGSSTDTSYWVTGFQFVKGTFVSKEEMTEFLTDFIEDNSDDLLDQLLIEKPDMAVALLRWQAHEIEKLNLSWDLTESGTLATGYALLASCIIAGLILLLSLVRFFALDKTFKWIGFSLSILSILSILGSSFLIIGWFNSSSVSSFPSVAVLAYLLFAITTLVLTLLSSKKKEKISKAKA